MSKGWKITLIVVGAIICTVAVNRFVSSAFVMELFKKRVDPNPTDYVFQFSREEVKQAVWRKIGKFRYRGMGLSGFGSRNSGKEKSEFAFDSTDYFRLSTGAYVHESFLYRTGGRGRFTMLELEIYLDSLGPRETKVRVETKKHIIFSGYGFMNGREAFFGPIRQTVPPTTIEQYQVLYKIGKELGVADDMPKVNYPKALDREELLKTYYNNACFPYGREYKAYLEGCSYWDDIDE